MSRPKRRILLIDKDEQRRSCTAVQLDVWGYRLADPNGHADLVLAFTPADEEKIVRLATERDCPSMVVWDGTGIVGTAVDRLLVNPDAAWLRETVKIMLIRKRGPRKTAREEFRAHIYSDVGNDFQVLGCQGEAN